jgi:hypothetical protein
MTEIIDEQFGGSTLYSPINGLNDFNSGNIKLFAPRIMSVGFNGGIPNAKTSGLASTLSIGNYILLELSGNSLVIGTDYADVNSSIYLITKVFTQEPTDSQITISIIYNNQERNIVLNNSDTVYYINESWVDRDLGDTNSGWLLSSAGNAIFNNVAVRGEINATGGTFAGYVSAGNLKLGTDVNSTNDGIYINTNNYWYDSGTFSIGNGTSGVTWNGTTLAVTGTVTATLGTIGGWTIGSTTLTGTNTTLSNTGVITVGTLNDVAIMSSADATYRLWIGNATAASAPFSITKTGVLNATGATITGTINATSGYFGSPTDGWTVNSTSISNSSSKNILSNYDPSFEGAWSTYWTSSGAYASKGSSIANVYDGKYSASIFHYTAGSDTDIYYLENSQTMVLPSTISGAYTLSLYLRTNASRTISVTVTPYIGATAQTPLTVWNISSTTVLTRYSHAFTFPSGTTGLRIKVSTASISISSYTTILEMDAMQLESGSSATAYAVASSVSIDAFSSNKFNISYDSTTKYNVNASGDIIGSTLQLQSTSDLTLYSSGHGLQIGRNDTLNLRLDTNEIQSVDGTGSAPLASTLNLNKEGGTINMGSSTSTPVVRIFGDLRVGSSPGTTYKFELDGSALISQNLRINGDIADVTAITATGIVSTTNEFQAGDGTAADPSYTFINDGDTGFYSYAANAVGFTTAGSHRGYFDNTTFWMNQSVFFPSVYSDTVSTRQVYVGSAGKLGTVASTRRVKSFIETVDSSIADSNLFDLELVTFKYNVDIQENGVENAVVQLGFIAEQAQELGLTYLYGVDTDGIPDYFAYEKLPLYMFAKIKKQEERIKSLEQRLAILEG